MTPWLTIVGVSLNGAASLGEAARKAIEEAHIVAGSERLLDLMEIAPERRLAWPSPLADGIRRLRDMAGQPVVVLATGDPMHFGIGATLAVALASHEYNVLPAPSSLSLAAARMGWALQDVACISLHGRPLERLHAALAPNTRLLLLTRDGAAPGEIMTLLSLAGYGKSRISVLENLGGSDEARHTLTAANYRPKEYAALNIVAVECIIDNTMAYLPPLPGLADGALLHDGQLTKRDVRAVTVSALIPTPGERLWDVGAGCGSIAIEWLRCARSSTAVAFERNEARLGMMRENALRLGVPHLAIVAGAAPDCLRGHPTPDAVFLGGAISDAEVFKACWQALRPGGRLVANAVTVEGCAALAERHRALGGELLQISISHARAVGKFHALKPAMAITQWRAIKP